MWSQVGVQELASSPTAHLPFWFWLALSRLALSSTCFPALSLLAFLLAAGEPTLRSCFAFRNAPLQALFPLLPGGYACALPVCYVPLRSAALPITTNLGSVSSNLFVLPSKVPGKAVDLAVGADDTVFAISPNQGDVYRWAGNIWEPIAGASLSAIAVGNANCVWGIQQVSGAAAFTRTLV